MVESYKPVLKTFRGEHRTYCYAALGCFCRIFFQQLCFGYFNRATIGRHACCHGTESTFCSTLSHHPNYYGAPTLLGVWGYFLAPVSVWLEQPTLRVSAMALAYLICQIGFGALLVGA